MPVEDNWLLGVIVPIMELDLFVPPLQYLGIYLVQCKSWVHADHTKYAIGFIIITLKVTGEFVGTLRLFMEMSESRHGIFGICMLLEFWGK